MTKMKKPVYMQVGHDETLRQAIARAHKLACESHAVVVFTFCEVECRIGERSTPESAFNVYSRIIVDRFGQGAYDDPKAREMLEMRGITINLGASGIIINDYTEGK